MPRVVFYGFFLDEARATMTVVAVHPDSASLEFQMDEGNEKFRKFGDFIELSRIEVYGDVSDGVRDRLDRKANAGARDGHGPCVPRRLRPLRLSSSQRERWLGSRCTALGLGCGERGGRSAAAPSAARSAARADANGVTAGTRRMVERRYVTPRQVESRERGTKFGTKSNVPVA